MNIVTRKLEESDIDQIIPLRMALQEYNNKIIDGEKKSLEKQTKKFLEENINKELFMFGTFVDDKLVSICGFIILKFFPQINDFGGKVAYINSVFTMDGYRKNGYQKKTFEKCLEFAFSMDIVKFRLNTINPEAIKMYSKFGFVQDESAQKMRLKVGK